MLEKGTLHVLGKVAIFVSVLGTVMQVCLLLSVLKQNLHPIKDFSFMSSYTTFVFLASLVQRDRLFCVNFVLIFVLSVEMRSHSHLCQTSSHIPTSQVSPICESQIFVKQI